MILLLVEFSTKALAACCSKSLSSPGNRWPHVGWPYQGLVSPASQYYQAVKGPICPQQLSWHPPACALGTSPLPKSQAHKTSYSSVLFGEGFVIPAICLVCLTKGMLRWTTSYWRSDPSSSPRGPWSAVTSPAQFTDLFV